MKLEKIVNVSPAFDRRHSDPSKNYGIHGCELRFVLKGELGAVQFLIYTNWHLPHVQSDLINKCVPDGKYGRYCTMQPMAADVGYHSFKPQYDGQPTCSDSCVYLNGSPCYYDGSGLHAEKVFKEVFVPKGTGGLWEYLEQYYKDTFLTLENEEADTTTTQQVQV